MNADKGSGILHGSLERLALHYGMIDMGKLAALRQKKSYGRGIKDFLNFASVFAATTQGPKRSRSGGSLPQLKNDSRDSPEIW